MVNKNIGWYSGIQNYIKRANDLMEKKQPIYKMLTIYLPIEKLK